MFLGVYHENVGKVGIACFEGIGSMVEAEEHWTFWCLEVNHQNPLRL